MRLDLILVDLDQSIVITDHNIVHVMVYDFKPVVTTDG